MTQPVQLSHDEFLLLLGMLRLPMPLALGENPTAGYTDDSLIAALTLAMNRLLARNYVTQPANKELAIVIAAEVEAVVRAIALAKSCLIIAVQHDTLSYIFDYSIYDDVILQHMSVESGIHEFVQLPDRIQLSQQVVAEIIPHVLGEQPLNFVVSKDALFDMLQAIGAGNIEAARNSLSTSDVPSHIANHLGELLGPSPVLYTFISIRNLQAQQPDTESVVAIQGIGATFIVTVKENNSEMVHVEAVDESKMQRVICDLVSDKTLLPVA